MSNDKHENYWREVKSTCYPMVTKVRIIIYASHQLYIDELIKHTMFYSAL